MLIRLAIESDLPSWIELATEVSPIFQHPADMGTDPEFIAYIKSKTDKNEALTAVDDITGDNIGFIGLSKTNNRISWFSVFEKYRCKGAGNQLLKSALEQLDHSKPITVDTYIEGYVPGIPAKNLYRKFGFVETNSNVVNPHNIPNCRMTLMKKPEMIIFDYGHTLLYEPDSNYLRGEEALFKYIKSNKNNLTPREVNDFVQELYAEIAIFRKMGMEIHQRQFFRLAYEFLEIELTISLEEMERVFWDNISAQAMMPDADKMIDYINANGIRSGVISNIGFSGDGLTERINRLLPRNKFEFIIASSEYMLRKPHRMLFELALKKAGLSASDVWFCGDTVKADIEGSHAVGMFPVWYENKIIDDPWIGKNDGTIPQFPHLHINEWSEFIAILERLK